MCKLIILLLILLNFSQDEALFRNLNSKKLSEHADHCRLGNSEWLQLFMRGGTWSEISKYPNIVSLRVVVSYRHFCGGSIISDRHVVTAAQCLCGKHLKDAGKFVVVTGATIIDRSIPDAALSYKVNRTLCHPDYMEISSTHDIALVYVQRTFTYSPNVNKIEMIQGAYKNNDQIESGLSVTLVGWSMDRSKNNHNSYLQIITSKTTETSECKKYMQEGGITHNIGQPDNEFCTFNRVHSTGMGNNIGTPVIHEGRLLGITIWGKCVKDVPDVHTSIKHHYPWIYHEVLSMTKF